MSIFSVNLHDLLVPQTSLLEIFIRGTVLYLSLFALLRLILKRQAGTLALTDLLMLVLLADASQNAMAGEYRSITEGIFLVTVIIFWNFFLDWLAYRVPLVERWLNPPALLLIRNGKMIKQNMRRERITGEELMSQVRLQGIEELASIRKAFLESDGRLSIITSEDKKAKGPPEKHEV